MTLELTIPYCPVCGVPTQVDICTGTIDEPHEPVPTIGAPLGSWGPVE